MGGGNSHCQHGHIEGGWGRVKGWGWLGISEDEHYTPAAYRLAASLNYENHCDPTLQEAPSSLPRLIQTSHIEHSWRSIFCLMQGCTHKSPFSLLGPMASRRRSRPVPSTLAGSPRRTLSLSLSRSLALSLSCSLALSLSLSRSLAL